MKHRHERAIISSKHRRPVPRKFNEFEIKFKFNETL